MIVPTAVDCHKGKLRYVGQGMHVSGTGSLPFCQRLNYFKGGARLTLVFLYLKDQELVGSLT